MTGKGHRMTGVGAGFFAAALVHLLGYNVIAEIIAGIAAASSTTVPDWIEIPIYKKGVRSGTLIPHRTITHWPFLWLGLIAVSFYYLEPYMAAVVIGICIGSLAHILADAPNPMGIPWLWPHKRVSIFGGLWRSGEFEKTMTFAFTLTGVIFWACTHQDTVWVQMVMSGWGKLIGVAQSFSTLLKL